MFLLDNLKTLCLNKLKEKLSSLWSSEAFPECVREVYSATSSSGCGMRSAVLQTAVAHARELGDEEAFKDLLREGGDFSLEYVDALTRKLIR